MSLKIERRPSEEIEQFLFAEARLLDERQFIEWAELFTDDGLYWVPATWDQANGESHVSLIHERKPVLRIRVKRLIHEGTVAQWPVSRTQHHLTNISEQASSSDEVKVSCSLLFTEFRRSDQRIFSADVRYNLWRTAEGLRIARKEVRLINAEAESGHLRLSIPF
jgi:benzoate/toluate 1,2-dioxygenase subunit beta